MTQVVEVTGSKPERRIGPTIDWEVGGCMALIESGRCLTDYRQGWLSRISCKDFMQG